jgi:nitroreductase
MDLQSVDELLTTTRSVRRRLDLARPVDRAVVERCIALAIQAPTGSTSQGRPFIVVTDPAR